MSDAIVIFGTGGFGREVLALLLDLNQVEHQYDIAGFLDGDATLHGSTVHGHPVLGGAEWLIDHPGMAVALAIGSPIAKRRVRESLRSADIRFPALLSPRAWVGPDVIVGQGTIICALAAVTIDIAIGEFVVLNLGVTIGHDSTLDDYVTLTPGVNVSGNVYLGEGVMVGTNASFIPGVRVGAWTTVGAGAVVTNNLPANVTAVGIPAKTIKEHESGWHL